ncbi:MAG: signal peptidase II [Clostridiales bacterium]|nr:signal peptidase II [Clostridiales bacterium]
MKDKNCRNYIKYFAGIILLTILDQVTKKAAIHYLAGGKDLELIPDVLVLHFLENRGAAFGILENQTLFFVLFGILILGGIGFCYFRLPLEKKYIPLQWIGIFISAGAVGNLIDRIFRGFVVDFIYFQIIRFPVFNVADIYVTVGSIVLIILLFFYYKDEEFNFLSIKNQTGKKDS